MDLGPIHERLLGSPVIFQRHPAGDLAQEVLAIYCIAVALIVIPTFLIAGLPAPERWYEVLYPFFGVAIIMGFYSLVAYLGKRRLEQNISE